jgi:hypothetical protein
MLGGAAGVAPYTTALTATATATGRADGYDTAFLAAAALRWAGSSPRGCVRRAGG